MKLNKNPLEDIEEVVREGRACTEVDGAVYRRRALIYRLPNQHILRKRWHMVADWPTIALNHNQNLPKFFTQKPEIMHNDCFSASF